MNKLEFNGATVDDCMSVRLAAELHLLMYPVWAAAFSTLIIQEDSLLWAFAFAAIAQSLALVEHNHSKGKFVAMNPYERSGYYNKQCQIYHRELPTR